MIIKLSFPFLNILQGSTILLSSFFNNEYFFNTLINPQDSKEPYYHYYLLLIIFYFPINKWLLIISNTNIFLSIFITYFYSKQISLIPSLTIILNIIICISLKNILLAQYNYLQIHSKSKVFIIGYILEEIISSYFYTIINLIYEQLSWEFIFKYIHLIKYYPCIKCIYYLIIIIYLTSHKFGRHP